MSKNKIGILTFHNANNYGAVLQAYALQSKLHDLFPEDIVRIINYRCNAISDQRSMKAQIGKQGIIRALVHFPNSLTRIRAIDRFCSKCMDMTEMILDNQQLSNVTKQFDVIVSGSDQVWNKKWNGNDSVYLQNFHSDNYKKISYAASFGVERLPGEWVDEYQKAISQFEKVSVRELTGKKIIEEQLGLSAEIHVDPTLLLSANDWDKLARDPMIKKPYVLVYMVPFQESVLKYAKQLCELYGMEAVIVSKSLKGVGGIYKGNSSIEEIVGLFKNAGFVVTNSFHGTAFSLIYKKRLAIELNNPRGFNLRSQNLLTSCQMIKSQTPTSGIIQLFDVDWELVEQNISKERHRSEEYLMCILSE